MKQSIFILVALWGLIGTFVPTESVTSQDTATPIQEGTVTELAIELKR